MVDALVLFPEEVWEIIINNLEDSTDFWNMFRAFPQLDSSPILQKKKPLWLFGLILPILIKWKNSKRITTTLLNCRLTCRHWSTAVDTFLESQPQLQAYHHERHSSGRFPWNPKAYMDETETIYPFCVGRKKSNHIGGVKFDNQRWHFMPIPSVSKFLQVMDHHPPERNPFLSRSLSITLYDYGGWGLEMFDKFWNDTFSLHEKFGKHVWFYKLQFGELYALDRNRFFAECIGKLTNLKSLHIMGREDLFKLDNEDNIRTFMEGLDNHWPPFPHLETLKICGNFKHLDGFLIKRFSANAPIRRVELEFDMWKPEYSQLFPNLTELDLLNIYAEPASVKNAILSLEAPQLAKLQLQFNCGEGAKKYRFGLEEDIFPWLKRFPMLKSFMLGEGCKAVQVKENGTLSPEADSIKSLQFLSIRTSFGMPFNFLLCLPPLLHLNLFVPLEPVVIDHSTSPKVRIWEEIQTGKLYDSNVWEVLPKLKTLNLLVEEGENTNVRASYEFHREDYEKSKRVAAGALLPTSDVNFSKLRQDIIDYTEICEDLTDKYRHINYSDGEIREEDGSRGDFDDGWPIF